MLEKSLLFISVKERPTFLEHGFNIFILVASDENDCYTDHNGPDVSAALLNVRMDKFDDRPLLSVVLVVGLYILACVVGGIVIYYGPNYNLEFVGKFEAGLQGNNINTKAEPNAAQYTVPESNTLSMLSKEVNKRKKKSYLNHNIDLEDEQCKEVVAPTSLNNNLYGSCEDSANKKPTLAAALKRSKTAFNSKARSRQYIWLLLTIGIYYTLPVIQLVLLYQSMSSVDGNRDLCYYNNECQYPLVGIQDFGNFFSNVGYIVHGIFFSFIVGYRWMKYKEFKKKVNAVGKKHTTGIPEQFGIFASLGLALILEGLLSACYHICPTTRNFQFDTTFMYVIAILLFLKLFQFRHPNLTQTAHRLFFLIGMVLIEESLGYYIKSFVFTIIFIISYMLVLLNFLFHIYWDGDSPGINKVSKQIIKTCLSVLENTQELKRIPWAFISLLLLNISIAVYILIAQQPDRSSMYLLIIFMVNMAVYLLFYMSMKLYHSLVLKEKNESIRWISWFYFVLAHCFALPSLYFFQSVQRNSNLTAAESRNLNAPCSIGIFDMHDIWHFLSASGLFYLFLFILTLEDSNLTVDRELITVF